MSSDLLEALPAEFRGAGTTVTRIAAGLSGAGVYRVQRGDETFVLKITSPQDALDVWLGRVRTQQGAGEAGVAPRVLHVDEARRAVLSEFMSGGPFIAALRDRQSRAAGLTRIAKLVRRVHGLPLSDQQHFREPREFVAGLWQDLSNQATVPLFAAEIVRALLDEVPPPPGPIVLSHNDANPSNIVFDGTRLCLLDWDVAGANEAYYDLATISFFFRLDETATGAMLRAYDGRDDASVPARLRYDRRIAGVLSGVASMGAACRNGRPGPNGDATTIDGTPTIDEAYARLRSGTLSLATADGQWTFGIALLRSSATF